MNGWRDLVNAQIMRRKLLMGFIYNALARNDATFLNPDNP
jgi:hypothetical protein